MQKAHFAVRACKQPGFMQRRIWPLIQICGFSGLPFSMVPCLHQCNLDIQRKLRECRAQKCNPCFGAKSPLRSKNSPFLYSAVDGRQYKFAGVRGYLSSWYRVCTNAILISKGSSGNAEPKRVNLVSVQKAHFAVRSCKQPGFMPRRKWQLIQVCAFSGLPFVMVPCLRQCNVDIKRKLRECRAQKCNPCFGAKSPLLSTGLQTAPFYTAP